MIKECEVFEKTEYDMEEKEGITTMLLPCGHKTQHCVLYCAGFAGTGWVVNVSNDADHPSTQLIIYNFIYSIRTIFYSIHLNSRTNESMKTIEL